jgi:hypothetical protein
MFDLLEKFENVEIKNDTRLSEEDKNYCDRQHALYVKVLNHCRNMFESLKEIQWQDSGFYESVSAENTYKNGSYSYRIYEHEFIKLDKDDFKKIISRTHDKFIRQINGYFRKKYSVTIEDENFETYLSIKKPNETNYYYGWKSITDEEKAEAEVKAEQYRKDCNAYVDSVLTAELHYNPIIDDIFESLGGFNFAEKAEKEIKDNAQEAANRWGKTQYELKNGKISFNILYSRKEFYGNEYRVSLDSAEYKNILRALTYFDSDYTETSIYPKWAEEFIKYEAKETEGIYDSHYAGAAKVIYFKYYKNGKWDVTFSNHTNALTFAKEFLGYTG